MDVLFFLGVGPLLFFGAMGVVVLVVWLAGIPEARRVKERNKEMSRKTAVGE